MSDPFSTVGWLRHVKGRRECSKVGIKQASQPMKKAGKMLALKQAEALRRELGDAWTRTYIEEHSGGVEQDQK